MLAATGVSAGPTKAVPFRAVLSLLVAALVLVGGVPAPARALGDAAHRLVNGRATTVLPEPLRGLFTANAASLRAHANDPDLWKAVQPDEGPNHYLELDAFQDLEAGPVPSSEKAHLKRHGDEAARHGRLPWRVAEVHGELVTAFRRRSVEDVLERAAVLGHYVADAHVPLHAVVNHDGQLTGQKGLHGRWEIHLYARYARQLDPLVTPREAEAARDPVLVTFTALRESLARVEEVLDADRRAAGKRDLVETPADDRYDDAYYSALYADEGGALAARMSLAAERVAGLWLSAWEKAGRPELDWSHRVPHVLGHSRLVVTLLEGAGAELVEHAAGRGAAPHLDALRREGTHGKIRPPFPARSAAAQGTLWTGAWPRLHGVVGDGTTRPAGTVLETTNGLRSTALEAEPLWVTAARQGVPTVVVGVAQAAPFAPFFQDQRFGGDLGRHLIVLGHQESGIDAAVVRARDLVPSSESDWAGLDSEGAVAVRVPVGNLTVPGLLFDDPEDRTAGLDTLALSPERDLGSAARLKPVAAGRGDDAGASVVLPGSQGAAAVHFRLFVLSPDGADVVLWHSAGGRTSSSDAGVEAAAEGLDVPGGSSRLYGSGAFGPRLWEGGDGTAERRYLDTVGLAVRQHERIAALAVERTGWGLLVLSLPFPAEALEQWGGRLDPGRPDHDAAVAIRLRPFLDDVVRLADRWVGEIARRIPADAGLAVMGERGLGGVHRVARPNVALEAAGLLATRDDGTIDLARTKVVYSPANGGFLVVNRTTRPEGIQPRRGEPLVRAGSIGAVREMKDPATDEPAIAELLVPDERGAPPGIGGPSGGFLYLRPAPGVTLSAGTRGPAVGPVEPRGDAFDPDARSAAGLFVVAGRGLASGRNLGDVAAPDVAPTFLRLLGLRPSPETTGAVIERALVPDPAPAEGDRLNHSR